MNRITTGTMSVGILAIIAGLIGALVLKQVLYYEKPGEQEAKMVTIPIASANLPAGRRIAMGDIVLLPMTVDAAREREYGQYLVNPVQIIGRVLRDDVSAGNAFLNENLHLQGTRADVTALLKPGFRAISLQINSVDGGNVSAGTTVDVIFRSSKQDNIPEITKTILQGLRVLDNYQPPAPTRNRNVLDITQSNRSYAAPSPTVTLEATLEQANVLRTITGHGEIALIPRPPGEIPLANAPSFLTLDRVLGLPTHQPQQPFTTVGFRRGGGSARSFGNSSMTPAVFATSDQISDIPMVAPLPKRNPAPVPAPTPTPEDNLPEAPVEQPSTATPTVPAQPSTDPSINDLIN